MRKSLLILTVVMCLVWALVWAQAPPNVSRTDGGAYIDKEIALFDYLLAQAIVGQDTTTVTVTNTVTETQLYAYTVPAIHLSTTRGIKLDLNGQVKNSSTGPIDYTLRVKYGGVTISTLRWQALASGGGSYGLTLSGTILGSVTAGAGKQACVFLASLGGVGSMISTPVDTGVTPRLNTCDLGVAGADMTTSQTLQVTIQMGTADANASVSKENVYVTRLTF